LKLSITGTLVDMRILLFGLTVFILTLAFTFWHDGHHDAAPVTRAPPEPYKETLVSPGAVASNPTRFAVAAPAAAVMTPSPAIPPTEIAQGAPDATLDVDDSRSRSGRAAERGSRAR
jgi:hypothetical protein